MFLFLLLEWRWISSQNVLVTQTLQNYRKLICLTVIYELLMWAMARCLEIWGGAFSFVKLYIQNIWYGCHLYRLALIAKVELSWQVFEDSVMHSFLAYTVKNATDVLQVVNFTGSFQLVNKMQQTCQFHQVATSLLKSGLLQLVICRLVTTCWNNLQKACG